MKKFERKQQENSRQNYKNSGGTDHEKKLRESEKRTEESNFRKRYLAKKKNPE